MFRLGILRWEIILDFPGGPRVITRVLTKGGRKAEVRKRERHVMIDEKVRRKPLLECSGEPRSGSDL